jgi:hypothetical protein
MSRFRLVVGVLVLLWAASIVTSSTPVNPDVDRSVTLEANASVPAPVLASLRRACFDCHSSETVWPWYSRVPPAAWLVVHDVNEGRGHMNLSEWQRYTARERGEMLDKMCELTTRQRMPLRQYVLVHRDAVLSADEIAALCTWTKSEGARVP